MTSVLLSSSTPFMLPAVYLIEYSIIGLIWFVYAFVWIFTIYYNTWTRPLGLSLAYGFVSKSFIIVAVQRWLFYGFSDFRTLSILAIVALHLVNYVFAFMEFVLSKKARDGDQLINDGTIHLDDLGDEGTNIFSKLFFWWTNPLIRKGYKSQINYVDDLFKLPPTLKVLRVEREFLESASNQFTDAELFSFSKALVRAFGLKYFSLAILRLFGDCFKFAGPVLLHLLITSLQSPVPDGFGYLFAALIAVYDKLLQIPACRLSKFSSGQLINFMSTDVDRIVGFVGSFHAVWSMPLNLGIALYLLYREVGLAFLSGLLAAIITVPLNKYIASKIGDMSTKMMHYKDQRIRLVTESMRAIRVVKLSNWEPFFEQKINAIRAKELKYLKARKYLDAVCVYLWASAPILITIAILSTYTVVMHEQLTAAKVFTSLALVNILILPLNAFPWVLNSMVEAYVSKKRFDKFFDIQNMEPYNHYALTDAPEKLLQLEKAKFSWSDGRFFVRNISFSGEKGSIIGIIGPVGCGKSTILMGILGETESMNKQNLSTRVVKVRQSAINEGFAYTGQECWLRRGTVKENIVCGTSFQPDFYQKVLEATALEHDIALMPGRDDYLVGDEGTTLSGGQRARMALARAIYQDNDVYLLDDPFASLDQNVGRFVLKNAIQGLLKEREKLVVISLITCNT
uniref:ABC-type xenobiotic transporter n=1 Tax=Ditylenchus dipsaci TaxID=166011 RepID=A0A915DCR7_9BILA